MSGACNNSTSHATLIGPIDINRPYCLLQCLVSLQLELNLLQQSLTEQAKEGKNQVANIEKLKVSFHSTVN